MTSGIVPFGMAAGSSTAARNASRLPLRKALSMRSIFLASSQRSIVVRLPWESAIRELLTQARDFRRVWICGGESRECGVGFVEDAEVGESDGGGEVGA